MKKIAHIVNSNKFSGLEKVVISIMKNMKNYKMIYVTKNGPIVDSLRENDIDYYIIDKMSKTEINKFLKNWKPDIIHAHDYTASLICALSKGRIPLISHIHNNSPWIKKFSVYSMAFLFSSMCSKIVLTVSDSIKNEYIFSKMIYNKIKKVSNPISCDEITKNVLEVDFNKHYDVCCCGRLTKQKNPFKFVDIIKKLNKKNNINAIWVGDGELKDDIIKYCKDNNVDNINFVGFKKNPYKYMANSKIFLLTSDWEGFGLVAFEAITLGVPSIVSNVGGLPDIIDESCGKLCDDFDEYYEELEKLINDKKYYNMKVDGTLKRAKKIENYKKYYEDLNGIYINLLKTK